MKAAVMISMFVLLAIVGSSLSSPHTSHKEVIDKYVEEMKDEIDEVDKDEEIKEQVKKALVPPVVVYPPLTGLTYPSVPLVGAHWGYTTFTCDHLKDKIKCPDGQKLTPVPTLFDITRCYCG